MVINMNMTVINKNNDKKYEVYDITYDNAGYPHFLIYKEGQWVRMSAKHFKPYGLIESLTEELRDFRIKNIIGN